MSIELALQVCLGGFLLGLFIFVTAMAVVGPIVVLLRPHLPGAESVIMLIVPLAALAICLLDFYVILPAFSLYTFRLVECDHASWEGSDVGSPRQSEV
jgi:hypothetical protein